MIMTTIRVELLTGRYTAGPQREWPPDPARLFYAAVAAWGEGGSDPAEREALLWWEQRQPPSILCSGPDDTLIREDVGHFVPINDVAVVRNLHGIGPRISDAAQRRDVATTEKDRAKAVRELAALEKKALQDSAKAAQPRAGAATDLDIMPEGRPKQLRTYPTVRPDCPVVDYEWPDGVPAELEGPLSKVLARIGRLGHSSTLVQCELSSVLAAADRLPATAGDNRRLPIADTRTRLVPDTDGDRVLRVPAPELLDELEIEYDTHRGRMPRRLPYGSAAYRWSDSRAATEPAPQMWERSGDHWLILEIERRSARERWQPDTQPALNVTRTVELTRAFRGAMLRHCTEPIPSVLSGHRGDQPHDEPHAMFLALPNAGSPHSDGSIGAAVLAIPSRTGSDDVGVIEDAVEAWIQAAEGKIWFGNVVLKLRPPRADSGAQSFDARHYTTTRSFWARPSRIWTSVTPIALDRFPRALRAKGALDFAAFDDQVTDLVTSMCVYRQLPAPRTVRAISGSPMVAVPPVGGGRRPRVAFAPYRTEGTGRVRYTTHLQITFDQPVRGPLVLGSARHFGYGLFLPSDRGGDQS